jgi:hypothetical protein
MTLVSVLPDIEKVKEFENYLVASLRRGVKKTGLTQRRDGATKDYQ